MANLRVERQGPVLRVTLARPDRRNAFDAELIAELAVDSNLPSICARTDYAENGCLMAYGPGYQTEGSDGARYVDRILKGAKPADLPIEQPTKFELVINLGTATALGITISSAMQLMADEVIE